MTSVNAEEAQNFTRRIREKFYELSFHSINGMTQNDLVNIFKVIRIIRTSSSLTPIVSIGIVLIMQS